MKERNSRDRHGDAAKSDKNLDLTFVPIERRALVRNRIAEIEEYLAHPSKGTAEAIKSAGRLGLNVSSFYRLVRSWRSHGDAHRLAGSGAKSKPFAKRVFGDEAFIAEALALLPPAGTVEQDMEAIAALAVERDIPIRSLSALRKEVRRLRPEYDRSSVPGDLVIARTAIDMPVQFGARMAMPVATVVADTVTDRIIAIQLRESPDGPDDFPEALLSILESGNLIAGPEGASSITFGGVASEDFTALENALTSVGLKVPEEVNRGRLAANEWVSRRLKSLNLKSRPRLAHQAANKRDLTPNSKLDTPVTIERAQAIVNSRIQSALDGAKVAVNVDETALIAALLDLLEHGLRA